MANTVRMPDGKLYDVTGHSQEDIEAARQNLFAQMGYGPQQKEDPGILDAFGRGLSRGIDQTSALVGDALPAIVADSLGYDDYRDEQLKEYTESMERMEKESPSYVPTYKDVDSVGDAALYASETVGMFIPSILTSIAGGGVGGFVGKKVAERFASKMAGDYAKKLATAQTVGRTAGFFTGSGVQTIPEAYTSIAEGTGEPRAGAAFMIGSINAALDSLLPAAIASKLSGRARKDVARSIFARMMKAGGKGAFVEGLTEGTQEANQLAAIDYINNNPDLLRGENLERVLEAGIRGSVGGGAISSVTGMPRGRPTPETDPELVDAAQAYAEGRPAPTEQLTGPDAVQQIGFDPTVQNQETREATVPIVERGERTERTVTDSDGRTQTIVDTPSVGEVGSSARVLTGDQQPFFETLDPETAPTTDARQNAVFVQNASRYAIDNNLDVDEFLGSPEGQTFMDEQAQAADVQDVNLTPTKVGQEERDAVKLNTPQLLEWGEQNKANDPQIANIMGSGVNNNVKAQALRQYLTRKNVTPATAEQASQTGDPILRPRPKTAEEGTVESTDEAFQPRMSRRKDTEQGAQLREEVGPVVNSALLEALRLRGGEASVRMNESGEIDEAATTKANTKYEGAVRYLNMRLNNLSKQGAQGKRVADSIRTQVMDNQSMGAKEIVGAFLAGDAVVDVLGGEGISGGVGLMFHKTLKGNGKHSLEGLKEYVNNGNQAVINLAFYEDDPRRVAQTASHEAFHILQDFYSEYSPSDSKLLESVYKMKDGKVNFKALPGTIKRLWKEYDPQLHRMALDGTLPEAMSSPAEFQAKTFELYKKAQQAGESNPLTGSYGRFFDFVGRFLPRLRNYMRGFGYQTAEDVFTRAASGKTAQQIKGKKVSSRDTQSGTEQSIAVDREPTPRDVYSQLEKLANKEGSEQSLRMAAEKHRDAMQVTTNEPSQIRVEGFVADTNPVITKNTVFDFETQDRKGRAVMAMDHLLGSKKHTRQLDTILRLHDANEDDGESRSAEFNETVARWNEAKQDGDKDMQFNLALDASHIFRKLGDDGIEVYQDRKNNVNVVSFKFPEDAEYGTQEHFSIAMVGHRGEEDFTSPFLDDYELTTFRLDEQIHDLFNNELVGKRTATSDKKITVIANSNSDYDSAFNKESVWNIDFSVDGQYTTQRDTPPKQTIEIFGKVLAGIRKVLDAIDDNNYAFGGIGFTAAGGVEGSPAYKKQAVYNKIARDPKIRAMFPELDAAQNVENLGQFETMAGFMPAKPDAGKEASLRLDRVPDLTQSQPSPANNDIVNQLVLSPRERALSALDILYNPDFKDELPQKDTEEGRDGRKRAKGRSIAEVGYGLQNKALAILGGQKITESNPETDQMLARVIASEVMAALKNNPEASAADWYTSSVERAIDAVAQLYPEVATDPEHRSAFAAALAITSQKIVVDRNSQLGLATYEFWRENGRFPLFGEGDAAGPMQNNFRLANEVQAAFGDDFTNFLSRQYSRKELEQALTDAGIKVGTGGVNLAGEGVNEMVYGSFIFGPKIGQGFYQNLMGNFDPVTIDLWFMRTWGRMTGTLVGKPEAAAKNIDKLKVMMSEEGIEFDSNLFGTDEQYTFDIVTRLKRDGEKHYKAETDRLKEQGLEKEDRIPKSPSQKESSNYITNMMKTIEQPRGPSQRSWIRSVVKQANDVLRQNGINITNADLQAIIWYPEKNLYSLLQSGKPNAEKLNQSYDTTFGELINGPTGIRSVDRGSGFDAVRESVRKADKKPSKKSKGNVGQEESIRFSTADYRTTDGMRSVLGDPTAKTLSGRVYNFLQRFTTKEGRANEGRKFINEFVHGLAPLARRELALSERRTGDRRYLPFAQSAFKVTELAQQIPGRMQMMYEFGAPKLNPDGSMGIVETTQGLKKIFEPIGQGEKYGQFQMYVYAKRAERLKQEGRENLMTDAQIAEGLGYGAANPEFDRVFQEYRKFNEALMQFLVDTGSINTETKNKLIGTADYVPFYRIIEEEQYTEGLFGQLRQGNDFAQNQTSAFDNPDRLVSNVIRKLKGGEEKIGDLYENIFGNTQAIISAGLRNVATRRTVDVVESLKNETDFYKGVDSPKKINKDEAKNNDNHFTYRENGVTKFYDVGADGELITAMRTFTPPQLAGFLKTLGAVGRFFRNAITITPSFMIANLIRGDMAGVVSVDAPLVPFVDTIRGLKNALTDSETVQEMKTIGGFGGYTFGDNNADFAKKMKRHQRRHDGYDIIDTPQRMGDMIATFFEKVNNVGEATEMATREAIFRKMTEAGSSKSDAAYEALNLINYSRRGNPQGALAQTFSMLIPLVPFLNARVQGLYRTGTAFSTEATPRNTIKKGLGLMGLSLGLYAISSSQDDWDKEPLHRKLNYYIIYAGDKKFLIPKPFEIGAVFSTIPELFFDYIKKRDGEEVKDAVLQIFLNNFSFNPIPQAVKPLVEVASNYDFFRGRAIESLGVRGLPTEMRSYSTTSETAKQIGRVSSALGISPIEAETLINGYAGSLGSYFLAGVDSILGWSGAVPQKPSGVFGDDISGHAAAALGLNRFVKDRPADPASKYMSDFYEMKREADEVVRGINRLREEGDYEAALEMRKDNRALISIKKTLNKRYVKLNQINDQIQGVKSSGLEPEAKQKKLNQLIIQRNRIVSDMAKLKKRIRDV